MQPPARAAIAIVFDMSGPECEEVYEVLADVGFTDPRPDEMPLLASTDGKFWAVTTPSSLGVFWESIEDVLSE